MDLSNDLISSFVKITNDTGTKETEKTILYGIATKQGEDVYVTIDGSEIATPVETTVEVNNGERVVLTIKDHKAVITGNITSPAVNGPGVETRIEETASSIILEVEALEGTISTVEQTADKINWIVKSGTDSSSMTLTDDLYSLIASNITLEADRIDLHGYVTANNNFKIDTDGSITATNADITGVINATSGTFSGNIVTNEVMKAYGSVYVGTEIWGGFSSIDGEFVSNSPLTLKATTTLNIEAENIYLKPLSEVVCGTSDGYANLRAREILAHEFVYTDDIRSRTGTSVGISNLEVIPGDGYLEFTSGVGAVRVAEANKHLYLQTGTSQGDTSSEVRCTLYKNTSSYANLRAYNVCAQNAVYANGVNVSSDRERKRDIELYETDALHEICTTPVYTYHLDTDLDEEIKRIGIIMQEAPLDAVDISGKGVDLYQMVTMLWKAVQQQQEMIRELKGE